METHIASQFDSSTQLVRLVHGFRWTTGPPIPVIFRGLSHGTSRQEFMFGCWFETPPATLGRLRIRSQFLLMCLDRELALPT